MKNARLAVKLGVAQILIIVIGALTLAITAFSLAPGLFSVHLAHTGEDSPVVRMHAREAFVTSLSLALVFAGVTSLLAAGLVSWLFVRRVAKPIEQLAEAADAVAAHRHPRAIPTGGFTSELRRLNESFARMSEDLELSEQRRTNLLADLAHELRTPLATLIAYVDGLEDGVVPIGSEAWNTLRSQLARMHRLVSDLKEASAADERTLDMDFHPVDVRAVAQTAVAIFRARCEIETKELRIVEPTTSLFAKADSQRLQQVLVNLLDNACRHTPNGGEIEVRLSEHGTNVVIEVSDSGHGIPADQLDAIFQRFYRLDPSRQTESGGSGLGLTIARAIISRHGGTIQAQSPGRLKGSSFTIRIPTART